MVDAQIRAITRTAPISPGPNLHPHLAHGHVHRGAGELLPGEVHDHENFDRPAVIAEGCGLGGSRIKTAIAGLARAQAPGSPSIPLLIPQ